MGQRSKILSTYMQPVMKNERLVIGGQSLLGEHIGGHIEGRGSILCANSTIHSGATMKMVSVHSSEILSLSSSVFTHNVIHWNQAIAEPNE